MSLRDKVVLMCVICLSYKVVRTCCEVVLVHRNITDSFRVGKDGCRSDSKLCPSSSTCQPDSGLCLCGHLVPNFVNPDVENVNGYKCVRSHDIRQGLDGLGFYCGFGPFQVIPYSHSEPGTEFRRQGRMTSCSLDMSQKRQAKFPNISNNMELQWLDDSYVQLSVSNNVLSFKWKRSVPGLQSTIITLYARCKQGNSYSKTCLRAKVFGTWPPEQTAVSTVEPTAVTTVEPNAVTTVEPTAVSTVEPTAVSTVEPTAVSTVEPTAVTSANLSSTETSATTSRRLMSSVHPSPADEVSGNDDGFSGTIIIIAVVVPVVLLIFVVGVLWWLCKRRRENNRERNSCRGRLSRKKDNAERKELTQRGSNGTKSSSAAQSNYGYSTAGDLSVLAEANPTYDATPSTARKQAIHDITYPTEPGYDTPDLKRVQARAKSEKEEVDSHYYSTLDDNFKGKEDDPQSSTPDIERVNVNGDMYALPDKSKEHKEEVDSHYYSTPDDNVKGKEDDAQYSKPDIKRVEVNGDMYALPDKSEKGKRILELDYLDSSQLYSDSLDKNKTSAQSDESTLYAEIDEAVKPPQKKKK